MSKEIKIKITKDGPYEVSGLSEFKERFISQNEEGNSWDYVEGKTFTSNGDKVYLCRCGKSKNPPFCDGSHKISGFNGKCTAPHKPILDNAQAIEGQNYTLYDNEIYCAFARFCDAYGRVWNLVQEGSLESDKVAIREALSCPAGRLMIQENKSGRFLEPELKPSIDILEDPAIDVSGPLFVKGKIIIEDEDGKTYEVRNRQTLCRCGESRNKPFCDGTHASCHFNDGEIKSRKIEK